MGGAPPDPKPIWGIARGWDGRTGADDAVMPRFLVTSKVLGCLLVVGGLVGVLGALVMQFHIENTEAAIYETALGRDQLAVVWLAVPLGVVAVVTRRPSLGWPCLALGLALVIGPVLRSQALMRPEAGERRAAAAFIPPAGAVPAEGVFDGYDFPSFRRSWVATGTSPAQLCPAAIARLAAWAGEEPSVPFPANANGARASCFATAVRGAHGGSISVREDDRNPSAVEVVLTVTRRQ